MLQVFMNETYDATYYHVRDIFEVRWSVSFREQLFNVIRILPYFLLWLEKLIADETIYKDSATNLQKEIADVESIMELHATLDLFNASSDFMTAPFQSAYLTPVQMAKCVAEFKTHIKGFQDECKTKPGWSISYTDDIIPCFGLRIVRGLGQKSISHETSRRRPASNGYLFLEIFNFVWHKSSGSISESKHFPTYLLLTGK